MRFLPPLLMLLLSMPVGADIVEDYLLLELSMPAHDAAHVDAYFGPPELKRRAETRAAPLDDILAGTKKLRAELDAAIRSDPDWKARGRDLQLRILALETRARMAQGEFLSFDEEAFALFNACPPRFEQAYFESILRQMEQKLPGEGSLAERVTAFREQYIIPRDRLAAVFETAMDECRRRTLEHIDLPEDESFTLEYVSDKPWTGYNWYQGNATSLIQVNTDLPIQIDRAVDLGCHEGYPGHHTYNALLEVNLVDKKGWREYSLYPLFSPQSLIAEGSANYGIEMAFPGEERVDYEKRVLFPLAGLDPAGADDYYALEALRSQLSYAGNEAARRYLDGEIDAEEAQRWLRDYAMMSPERAAQRMKFIDTYRSYVINYNYGKDLVANWVEAGEADAATRWQRYIQLLSTSVAPSDLE
jgi:hypothetical protein